MFTEGTLTGLWYASKIVERDKVQPRLRPITLSNIPATVHCVFTPSHTEMGTLCDGFWKKHNIVRRSLGLSPSDLSSVLFWKLAFSVSSFFMVRYFDEIPSVVLWLEADSGDSLLEGNLQVVSAGGWVSLQDGVWTGSPRGLCVVSKSIILLSFSFSFSVSWSQVVLVKLLAMLPWRTFSSMMWLFHWSRDYRFLDDCCFGRFHNFVLSFVFLYKTSYMWFYHTTLGFA